MSDFTRLINASDLTEWIMESFPDWCEGDVRSIINHIDDMPSAESEQNKGKWIDDGTELGCCCSECGVTLDDYFCGALHEVRLSKMPKFCQNCGSYNGGEQE